MFVVRVHHIQRCIGPHAAGKHSAAARPCASRATPFIPAATVPRLRGTMKAVSVVLLVALLAQSASASGGARSLAQSARSLLNGSPTPGAKGVSTKAESYLVPVVEDAYFTAILTTNDTINGYKMAGTPDGLGAYDNGDGTFTLLSNHEFEPYVGAVRAHGRNGSFVSRWTIRKSNFEVLKGEDLIKTIYLYNRSTKSFATGTTNFARFCSASLGEPEAFYNKASGKGTQDRLFLNGEEDGPTGRAWAHIVTGEQAGTSYELPWFGRGSWENWVANPALKNKDADKTVVSGTCDNGHNRVFIYVGNKQSSGNPVEKAGLQNGKVFAINLEGLVDEQAWVGGRFMGKELDVSKPFKFCAEPLNGSGDVSGAGFEDLTNSTKGAGILPVPNRPGFPTRFDRPEDNAWDKKDPSVLYFQTTAAYNTPGRHSRLWKLKFDDPTMQASKCGVAEVLINGPDNITYAGVRMLDNLDVSDKGYGILDEDIGKQPELGRVWGYNIATKNLRVIGQFRPELFKEGVDPSKFKTIDEEASGVIDVSHILGDGWWLLDAQSHLKLDDEKLGDARCMECVEDGQFLALYVDKAAKRK